MGHNQQPPHGKPPALRPERAERFRAQLDRRLTEMGQEVYRMPGVLVTGGKMEGTQLEYGNCVVIIYIPEEKKLMSSNFDLIFVHHWIGGCGYHVSPVAPGWPKSCRIVSCTSMTEDGSGIQEVQQLILGDVGLKRIDPVEFGPGSIW